MNLYPYSMGFTSVLSFVLGIFVIYKNPRNVINITWGMGCLCCGGWSFFFAVSFFSRSMDEALFFVRLLNIFAGFIPVFVAHFCKEITGINKEKKGLIYFGYFSAGVYSLAAFTDRFCAAQSLPDLPYYSKECGTMYRLFTAHFFFYTIYGGALLIQYLKIGCTEKRNQIKYILTGLTLGFAGGVVSFLPTYGVIINLFPTHFVWLYAAIISYAILKHQLMDIKVVIEKTLMYSFFLAMTSVFYFLMVLVAYNLAAKNFAGHPDLLPDRLNLYVIPPLLGGILTFGLGLFVYMQDRKSPSNRLFSLMCILFFTWLGSYAVVYSTSDESTAIFFARAACTAAAFMAVVPYHFVVSVLGIKNEKRYIIIAYTATIIFFIGFLFTNLLLSGVYHYFWGYYSKAGILHPVYLIVFYLIWARSLCLLYGFQADKVNDASKRNQARYLLAAFLFAIFSSIDYLPKYGFEFYPVGFIFAILFAFIVTYAIINHSLLDIRAVLKTTALYSLFLILVSSIYVFGIFLIYKVILNGASEPSGYIFKSLILVFIIAILLKPMEIILQRFLDKKFFKGSIVQIAEQNKKLESEIERSERLKSVGILAAGMAHEIKNPLTAIKTFAEYLPQKGADPVFREKFSRLISEEAGRISVIVRDLLLFAKPGIPAIAPCNPAEILRDISELLKADMLKSSVELQMHEDTPPPKCLADRAQIKQAFLNIILNAIDAMMPRGGGRLSVSILPAGRMVEIAISDTGIGIEPDKIAYLFDPFYSNKDGGTGLGLAITHSIIEKHRGKIEVESVMGEGTVFKILLPKG